MVWYAAEPVVPLDMPRALALAAGLEAAAAVHVHVQRIAAVGTDDALRVLTDRLGRTTDQAQRLDLVDGITQIVGKRRWPTAARRVSAIGSSSRSTSAGELDEPADGRRRVERGIQAARPAASGASTCASTCAGCGRIATRSAPSSSSRSSAPGSR